MSKRVKVLLLEGLWVGHMHWVMEVLRPEFDVEYPSIEAKSDEDIVIVKLDRVFNLVFDVVHFVGSEASSSHSNVGRISARDVA